MMKKIKKILVEKEDTSVIEVLEGFYTAGAGIDIADNNTISVKVGRGLCFGENRELELSLDKECVFSRSVAHCDHLMSIAANANGYVGLSKDRSSVYYSADLVNWERVQAIPSVDPLENEWMHIASLAGKFVVFLYKKTENAATKMYILYSLNGTDWFDDGVFYSDKFDVNNIMLYDSESAQFWYVIRKDKPRLEVAVNGVNFTCLQNVNATTLNDTTKISDVCFNGDSFVFLDGAKKVAFLPKNGIPATMKYNRLDVDVLNVENADFLKYGNSKYVFASKTSVDGMSKVCFVDTLKSGVNVDYIYLDDAKIVDLVYSSYSEKFYVLVKDGDLYNVIFVDVFSKSYSRVLSLGYMQDCQEPSFFFSINKRVGILYNCVENNVETVITYMEFIL